MSSTFTSLNAINKSKIQKTGLVDDVQIIVTLRNYTNVKVKIIKITIFSWDRHRKNGVMLLCNSIKPIWNSIVRINYCFKKSETGKHAFSEFT